MTDDFYAPEHRRRRQISMIAVVSACALALAAAFWLWGSLRALDAREALLGERMDALAQREETLGVRTQAQASALNALSGAQGGIAQRLDALYGARRAGLLAAESEYLVRLAMQRLSLAHDADAALTLLTAADASLRDIRDVDVHAARAAIAADSARLREIAMIDVESVYVRLAALPGQVDRVATGVNAPVSHAGKDSLSAENRSAGGEASASWWQRLTTVLGTLVNIRHVDTPLAPLATRGEKQFAVQNFRLLIEQAQLALLMRQGEIYQHSLVQAGDWLDRLAAGDPVLRHAVRRELSSLQAIAPGTTLPDLGASLAATRALAVRATPEAGATP